MTGTNCDLFTHKSSRSYLNHLVLPLYVITLVIVVVVAVVMTTTMMMMMMMMIVTSP
jgi:hypothetical protein